MLLFLNQYKHLFGNGDEDVTILLETFEKEKYKSKKSSHSSQKSIRSEKSENYFYNIGRKLFNNGSSKSKSHQDSDSVFDINMDRKVKPF